MRTIALYLAAMLGACNARVIDPPTGSDCVAACERARALSCPSHADPSPSGATCEVWRCLTPDLSGRSACVARATSCEEMAACP